MSHFEVTLASGRKFVVDERDADRLRASMNNGGPRSMQIRVDGDRPVFVAVDHVETVEPVVDAVKAAPLTG